MALPDPTCLRIFKMTHHWERLRIVDNDPVVTFEMEPNRILEHALFIDGFFACREVGLRALQCVMNLFGAGEELGGALDHAPSGFKPQ